MSASTTRCNRDGCEHPPSFLLVTATPIAETTCSLVRTDVHACELHAIEDDDAGHVRRAIRLQVKA